MQRSAELARALLDTLGWVRRELSDGLECIIRASEDIDWLLHLTLKRYRDHSRHQRSVALLADFLMSVQVKCGVTLADYAASNAASSKLESAEEVQVATWLAALLHDHAYPLAHLLYSLPGAAHQEAISSSGQESMRDLLARSHAGLFSSCLCDMLRTCSASAMECRIEEELRRLLVEPGFVTADELKTWAPGVSDRFRHGLLSAANLSARLGVSGIGWVPAPRERIYRVVRAALRAMALHSAPESCLINVSEEPVAFVLLLCDELQEWGRRMLGVVAGDAESDAIEVGGIRGLSDHEAEGITSYGRTQGTEDEPDVALELGFAETLTVEFRYPDERRLRETGWRFERFQADKRASFGRLRVPQSDFSPIAIAFHVHVPASVDFR